MFYFVLKSLFAAVRKGMFKRSQHVGPTYASLNIVGCNILAWGRLYKTLNYTLTTRFVVK